MKTHYANQDIKISYDNTNDLANVSMHSDIDGKKKNAKFTLDKHDLLRLNTEPLLSLTDDDLDSVLNIDSVQKPLDQRLRDDFGLTRSEPKVYYIELPNNHVYKRSSLPANVERLFYKNRPVSVTPRQHHAMTSEDLIIPISLNKIISYRDKTHKKKTIVKRRTKKRSTRGRGSRRYRRK